MGSAVDASAENRAADTRDEVVRPSNVIRDIIGRGRLSELVARRDGRDVEGTGGYAPQEPVRGHPVRAYGRRRVR